MFERSFETQKIVEALEALKPGETATYKELSKIAGVQISSRSHPLVSARSIVERDKKVNFCAIAKVGIRLLMDDDTINEGNTRRAVVGARAKQNLRRLANIRDYSALSDDKKRSYLANTLINAKIIEGTSAKEFEKQVSLASIDGAAQINSVIAALTGK